MHFMILKSRLKGNGKSAKKKILEMFAILEKNDVNLECSIDKLLNRTKPKQVNEMLDIMEAISKTCSNNNEVTNFFLYSYFTAFSSGLTESGKEQFLSSLKDCVETNQEVFADSTVHTATLTSLIPMKNPMSEKTVSWTSQNKKQMLSKLAQLLLKNNIPVLIVGEKFADEVYEEIITSVRSAIQTTKIYNYSHANNNTL